MPILNNAKKALRASKRKAVVNNRTKSIMKTMIDKAKKNPSAETVKNAYSSIDKSVKKNIIHRNKAGRLKSHIAKLIKQSTEVKPKITKVKKASEKSTVKSKKS